MRAFVTGGGGFIGSHLVDLLVERGHEASVLLAPGERGEFLPASPAVAASVGDVLDAEAVLHACPDGVDVIYHLAARTDLAGRSTDDYAVNTAGTANVLAAAERRRAGRFVLFSSMLAVAPTGRTEPIDEAHDAESPEPYGRSKRQAERIVQAGPLPWTIVRPTMVYGPRERSTMLAMFRAIGRGRFMLIGPDVLHSFVHVANLVEGVYAASMHPAAAGETFFLNDARPYTLAEFAAAVARALGREPPTARLPRPVAMTLGAALGAVSRLTGRPVPLNVHRVRTMTSHYVYSVGRARRAFGYDPKIDLDQGVLQTVAWYRSAGWLD